MLPEILRLRQQGLSLSRLRRCPVSFSFQEMR
jgi:hypothetical protein